MGKNDTDKVRIIALIRSDIKFRIREDFMSTNQQTIWIEIIKNNSKNVLCGGVYRVWNSENPEGYADELLIQFQKATEEDKPTCIIGDMNLCTKKWKDDSYEHKVIANKWRSGLAK